MNRATKRFPSVLLLAAVWAAPARAQSGDALTADQAVREALARNPGLVAERLNTSVADSAIVTASLRPNPVATVSLFRPDGPIVDAGVSPYEQVFRADYVLERGGKRDRRVEQATLSRSVTELQLANTTRGLVLDVEGAFIDVQLAKANLALARDNLQSFDNVVQINAERVRTGDLSQVELSRSRLAALQFQNDVRQQDAKLRIARNRLSSLIGRGPNGDALDVVGEFRREPGAIEYDALLRQARDGRPDLKAVRADQARSAADLRLQIANGVVDYTISGEFHRQESSGVRGNSYGIFFSAPLPVFNRNQGEVARARVQERQLQARALALDNDIASDVASAYAQYTATREIVDTIERQMLTQARDVRTTMEYSYRRGEASFVEFLDAVRAFNDTMQSFNEARADYSRSLYTLDAISGKVNP